MGNAHGQADQIARLRGGSLAIQEKIKLAFQHADEFILRRVDMRRHEGAGREKRIYAVPPYTPVRSLDFEDHPFRPIRAPQACAICGSKTSYLDELVTDDAGGRDL